MEKYRAGTSNITTWMIAMIAVMDLRFGGGVKVWAEGFE